MTIFQKTITITTAAKLLSRNEAVIIPTETFYGIACRALSPKGAARVFCAKNRPSGKPLPVVIGDISQIDMVACVPTGLHPLFDTFWPGPLSILMPARKDVPDTVTAGTGRIAIRHSSHPAAAELAQILGEPITASSANVSGGPAVRLASDLDPSLIRAASGIVIMPPAPAGGMPSTLVEPAGPHRLRILRQGAISAAALQASGFSICTD